MPDSGPGITYRRVARIALPIVLSNATVPILGAVDTGVIGQLGEVAPIGAVGIGAIVLTALYWVFSFLRMGTSGLTSQAHGAGQAGEVAAMLTRGVLIGLVGGAALILLQGPLFWGAFQLAPASAEVESLARDYMQIRVFSAPAMIALFAITGWLIALERTAAVLMIQLVMNGLNIGLDLWFVLTLDWGIEGVAWATFLSECCGLALGLWLCRAAFRVPSWRDWPRVFDRARLRRMASVNSDILLRSLMIEAILVSFLFLGSDMGDLTLAANQVLLQFMHITSNALDGFAFAAEALVGQALGAGNRGGVRRAAITTSQMALACVLVLSVGFFLFGGAIVDVMVKAPEVQMAARTYLPYIVLAPLLGVAAWMLDGIFIGATWTRDMRNMMALSLLSYICAVLLLYPLLGNHGLWLAMLISFVARGVTLGLRYPGLEAAVRSG